MRVLPRRRAEWMLVIARIPGQPWQPIGVLLADSSDTLHVRFRCDWSAVASAEDAAILSELEADLIERGEKSGALAVFDCLESSASHAVQIGARQQMETNNVEASLTELFHRHVGGVLNPTGTESQSYRRSHVALISGQM